MVFLSICPRDKKYLEYAVGDIPLRVVLDDGAEINPDVKVNVTDLNKGYKHFKIDSGKGNELKVTVMIHRNDKITGRDTTNLDSGGELIDNLIDVDGVLEKLAHNDDEGNLSTTDPEDAFGVSNIVTVENTNVYRDLDVYTMLNYFYRHGIPLMLKAKDLRIYSSSLWLITGNKSRKYERGGWSYWDLTFTKYDAVKYATFTKVNKGIQKALKKSKSKKSSKVSAATKLRKQLKKCKPKVLVYSKKKKTVGCVKTLQKYLNERIGSNLKADGWFGKETTKAVKKYQEKFSKSYGLKPTGKVNQATYNVMIGKGKKKVDTKAVKKELLNSFNPNKKKTSKKTSKKSTKPTQIGKTITIKSDTTGILR